MDDLELLRRYATSGSEQAFAELVSRHIDMVYAACLRRLRHRADAEDATQAVFLLLARKARSISSGAVLAGWLYRAAHFVASDTARAAAARRKHEMTVTPRHVSELPDELGPDPEQIDRALRRLRSGERDAILLRYFEGLSCGEVARQLHISQEAARKRVSRALDHLRRILQSPGEALPSVAAAEALLRSSLHPAPKGLAAAAVKAGTAAAGAPAASALAKGASILMALSKTKAVAVWTAAALLLGGGTVATWNAVHGPRDETIVIPTASAAITLAGDDHWQDRFNRVYQLDEGQAIKPVEPPLIPQRQQFWDDQCRRNGGQGWKLGKNELLTIEWDGSAFHWSSIGSMGSLQDAIRLCAGVKPYELDSSLPQVEFHSDWVSRKGATTEQKMAALAGFASARLGREVRFEKRHMMRDAIVVRGQLASGVGLVTLTDGRYPKNLGQPPAQQADLGDFLRTVEDRLRRKVFDETGQGTARLTYRDLMPGDQHLVEVLAGLAKQTSLTFTVEPREIEVWTLAGSPASDRGGKSRG